MIAKKENVSGIVWCELYKFYERVQTDTFVVNEVGEILAFYFNPLFGSNVQAHSWTDYKQT